MTSPKDLLSAYADGALTGDERAEVEAYIDADAGAAAEVDDVRALIAQIRDAAPAPATEPAWDDMARSIRAACDQVRPGLLARIRAWLRARPATAGGLGVAVAAAAVLIGLRATATDDRDATTVATATATTTADPELVAALPTMADAWTSDAAGYELADPDEVDAWLAVDADAAAEVDDPGLGFDVAPTYDDLLDDLTDEELEALAESLAAGRPS